MGGVNLIQDGTESIKRALARALFLIQEELLSQPALDFLGTVLTFPLF